MGIPLYVIFCFSLAAFNIFSLNLIFVSFINMCLGVFLLRFILYGTLCFLNLGGYFLSCVREVFHYNLFRYFLRPFLFLFFSGTPIIRMLVPLVLSQRSLRLSSIPFTLFFFILLLGSYFHHSVLQLTYSFFCLSYSVIGFF